VHLRFLFAICAVRCSPFQSVPYVVFVVSFLQDGRTPLWVAASEGQSEVVSLLLERGADKEARDTKVSTLPSLQTSEARSWLGHIVGLGLLLGR